MSELKRAKKYLDMIPDELRDNPNVSFEIRYLVQLLAAMTAKVEELDIQVESLESKLAKRTSRLKTLCSTLLKCRQAAIRGLSAEQLRLKILAETEVILP